MTDGRRKKRTEPAATATPGNPGGHAAHTDADPAADGPNDDHDAAESAEPAESAESTALPAAQRQEGRISERATRPSSPIPATRCRQMTGSRRWRDSSTSLSAMTGRKFCTLLVNWREQLWTGGTHTSSLSPTATGSRGSSFLRTSAPTTCMQG